MKKATLLMFGLLGSVFAIHATTLQPPLTVTFVLSPPVAGKVAGKVALCNARGDSITKIGNPVDMISRKATLSWQVPKTVASVAPGLKYFGTIGFCQTANSDTGLILKTSGKAIVTITDVKPHLMCSCKGEACAT